MRKKMMGDMMTFKKRRKGEAVLPGAPMLLPMSVTGTSSSPLLSSPLPLTLDQFLRGKRGNAAASPEAEGGGSCHPVATQQWPLTAARRRLQAGLKTGGRGRADAANAANAANTTRERPDVAMRNGVVLTLRELKSPELAFLQRSLTYYPPQLFDSKPGCGGPSARLPILAYSMDCSTISIPRMLGWRLYPHARDELVDGEAFPPELAFVGQLKPSQKDVVQAALSEVLKPPHGAVLTLPCGFGKTVLALHIAWALGRRTLVIVHKEFLLSQWKERIRSFLPGASVGILQGKKEEIENDFVLGMVQTIASRDYPLEFFDRFGTLICDEVHHYASRMFSLVFFKNRIRHVLGLSATPQRKDGLTDLVHHYVGDFAAKVEDGCGGVGPSSPSSAARICRVLRVAVKSASRRTEEEKDMTSGAVQKLKGRLALDQRRNSLILELVGAMAEAGRRVIVLSERVAHLEALCSDFAALGQVQTSSLYIGATKAKDREKAAGSDVIFATFSLAAEGLDIEALDTLLLATPVSDVVQAVGRILRQSDTKQPPLVVDITDDTCAAFERIAAARASYYRRCGYLVVDTSEKCDVATMLSLVADSRHFPRGGDGDAPPPTTKMASSSSS